MVPSPYAKVERERRFLMVALPDQDDVVARRRIDDRYIEGTRLRLRRVVDLSTGECTYKLTQKLDYRPATYGVSWITTAYLDPTDAEVLSRLPASSITKVRLSVPPLGVDVFEDRLAGLILGEVEFKSDAEMRWFEPPPVCVHDVTADPRFTGARLSTAPVGEVLEWLREYGIDPLSRRRS